MQQLGIGSSRHRVSHTPRWHGAEGQSRSVSQKWKRLVKTTVKMVREVKHKQRAP